MPYQKKWCLNFRSDPIRGTAHQISLTYGTAPLVLAAIVARMVAVLSARLWCVGLVLAGVMIIALGGDPWRYLTALALLGGLTAMEL